MPRAGAPGDAVSGARPERARSQLFRREDALLLLPRLVALVFVRTFALPTPLEGAAGALSRIDDR